MQRAHRLLAASVPRISSAVALRRQLLHPRCISALAASRRLQLSPAASPRTLRFMCVAAEGDFHKNADATLDMIYDRLAALEDQLDDAEVTISQGVLTANLGEKGSWVINKQTPNRQIWWSSPLSGPRRYEYDDSKQQWCFTRDKSELLEQLRAEIKQTTGIDI